MANWKRPGFRSRICGQLTSNSAIGDLGSIVSFPIGVLGKALALKASLVYFEHMKRLCRGQPLWFCLPEKSDVWSDWTTPPPPNFFLDFNDSHGPTVWGLKTCAPLWRGHVRGAEVAEAVSPKASISETPTSAEPIRRKRRGGGEWGGGFPPQPNRRSGGAW